MRRVALLVAPLLVLACRTLPGAPPDAWTVLPADDARPAQLLSALSERARQRRSLRGLARLAVDADGGDLELRGRQILVLERPDRLRVEILGFLRQTQAVLVTDAGRYELFTAAERRYDSGELYPGLLWDVARIGLQPDEVIDLLLGAPLPDDGLALDRALGRPDGGVRLQLASAASDRQRELGFDAEGRLRRLAVRGAGRPSWEARFGSYDDVDGAAVAHAIAVEFPESRTRAELSLEDVELNPELPEGLFQLRAAGRSGG